VIPKDCKRLAEVDFPIAEVSRHAAREKSIRHGHPSTLHLWWARRPLASSRAVLLALLWPDPCDPLCPEGFKKAARELLPQVQGRVGSTDEDLRKALFKFIADFANWDNAAQRTYLEVSRALVKAAHGEEPPLVVDPFAGGGSIPLEALRLGCEAFASDLNPVACLILKVMLEDIPRHGPKLAEELRRVGAEIKKEAEKELADLYPKDPDLPAPRRGKFFIYVLKCSDDSFYIGQTEDIPRRLKQHEASEVSWTSKHLPVEIIHWEEYESRDAAVNREHDLKTGFGRKWLKREYEAGRLAARQAGGATPIAYLWARTVRCESPNCGAEIPLARSFWLCKKPKRRRALQHRVVRSAGEAPIVKFEVFEPKAEKDVPGGTVTRAKATCLACPAVLPPVRVRAQLAAQRGGADVVFDAKGRSMGGARMLAVVTLKPGGQGRHYRLPTERDYQAVRKAQERLAAIVGEWERDGKMGLCPVPDEPVDQWHHDVNRLPMYGMRTWGEAFTARQKVVLVRLAGLVRDLPDGTDGAVREGMAIVVNRCADYSSGNCRWVPRGEYVGNTYGRQALSMVWDFCEISVVADAATGGYAGALDWVARVGEAWPGSQAGQVQCADAAEHPLPDQAARVWFIDPPYYDAIDYAHCSDFFYVWLKRTLPGHPLSRDPFDPKNPLTPKVREIVVDSTTTKGHGVRTPQFYEASMGSVFAEGRRVLREDGVGAVVFAHKTTEGWEALLTGMIRGGWTITGSWPIATEMGSRLRARESAALATSVHLICRPRPDNAGVGDWADVLRELPNRVGDWMERLQGEGVRGADLVFACIGPALEIFSRYAKVETADGREVALAEYLAKVWEVVGRSALAQVLGTAEAKARNGAAGAVEEDARLTALFLWTLQSTNGETDDSSSNEGEDEEPSDDDDGEEGSSRGRAKGFTLVFDVVRRFAQPLGIELPKWEGRVIETKKGVVRLLPIAERAKQLFGEDGAQAVASRLEQEATTTNPLQGMLFPDMQPSAAPAIRGRGRIRGRRAVGQASSLSDEETAKMAVPQATTLDRVHAAMLLQAGGRTNALRALLKAEQERGPDFLRLANAFSALYPKGSEEKRLIDAMLLAVPR
jgi:adenine-specific DNA methylase